MNATQQALRHTPVELTNADLMEAAGGYTVAMKQVLVSSRQTGGATA